MQKLLFPLLLLMVFSGCADGGTGENLASNAPPQVDTATRNTSCKLDIMNKANTADVNLIGSKRLEDTIHFRYAVGFDQKLWRCISFQDGENSISQIEHHNHEHKKKRSEEDWDIGDPLSD